MPFLFIFPRFDFVDWHNWFSQTPKFFFLSNLYCDFNRTRKVAHVASPFADSRSSTECWTKFNWLRLPFVFVVIRRTSRISLFRSLALQLHSHWRICMQVNIYSARRAPKWNKSVRLKMRISCECVRCACVWHVYVSVGTAGLSAQQTPECRNGLSIKCLRQYCAYSIRVVNEMRHSPSV